MTNLLDMTRIESGALELRPSVISFDELVAEALAALGGLLSPDRVVADAPDDLPLLHIDHVLISQVLANVLENAGRLAPEHTVIEVTARPWSSDAITGSTSQVGDRGERRGARCASRRS